MQKIWHVKNSLSVGKIVLCCTVASGLRDEDEESLMEAPLVGMNCLPKSILESSPAERGNPDLSDIWHQKAKKKDYENT